MCIKRFAPWAIVVATLIVSDADAQDCVAGLKSNDFGSNFSFASRLSYLQNIDESNYRRALESGSVTAILPGVGLNSSYQEFSEERKKYTQRFSFKSDTEITHNYFLREFPPEAYRAYSECIRASSNSRFKLWVSAKTNQFAAISYQADLPHNYRAKINVVSSGGDQKSFNVIADSVGTFMISASSKEDHIVVGDLVADTGQGLGSVTVELPRERIFKQQRKEIQHAEEGYCAAGGDGSTTGSFASFNPELVAKETDGYFLDNYKLDIKSNNGIIALHPNYEASPRRIKTKFSCEANNGHTQRRIDVILRATEVVERYVEQ